MHYPNCILCLADESSDAKFRVFNGKRSRLSGYYVNYVLKDLAGDDPQTRWLLTEQDTLPAEYESLGHFGHHDLFIAAGDRWKLSQFTLFVLLATAQSDAESASAGGGGAGGGGGANKKGSAAQAPNQPQQLLSPQ
jgi:hypothetical protein